MHDSTQRFSDRVEHYVRYRPGYPPGVIETLRAEARLSPGHVIADIGSGTGISARPYLENGNTVYGIEPNGPMRQAAEQLLATYPNFHSVDGTAEATTLADRSVDLVLAMQAFHWFEQRTCRAEFSRILRPGGFVALIWNERRTDSTPFLRDYEQLLLTCGTDYQKVRHENVDTAALAAFFGAGGYRSWRFDNVQHFDYPALRGRLLSSSYAPAESHPAFPGMIRKLEQIFQAHAHDGTVAFEYDTRLYLGTLA